jgi:hypothetical protein
MLAGDLPIRDYTEEGLPLTVVLSAGAQLVLGESLFAEAMLVMMSLSVAAAVTCWLTSRMTGSPWLGVGAALLQVVVYPRLYSHPKMLLYSVFLLIAWWYLEAPSRRRLGVLALWTVASFLMRHDHGVYIGLGSVAAIAVAHWRTGTAPLVRRGVEYGIVTLVLLAPYLAYVQYQQGIVEYFRTGLAISGSEASRTRIARLTFDPLPAGAWVIRRPVDATTFPGLRVRWKPEVDDARRRSIETELGLLAPEHAEGRTWRYHLEPPGHATLSRLVSRTEVEDTSGFDRVSLVVPDERSVVSRAWSTLGLDRLNRLEAGPRLIAVSSPHNVSVMLFFVLWSLPVFAITLVAMLGDHATTREQSFTLTASALMIVCAAGLLRDSLAERIADIYGSAPLLLACVVAAGWSAYPQRRVARMAVRGAVMAVAIAFVAGTFMLGHVPSQLNRARVAAGPEAVWQRVEDVFHYTRDWPWANAWPAGTGWKVARYVHDCTRPGDRLLMTWSAPEMNVFSRRAFAGGETALLRIFRQPREYESSVVARLSRQSVPIVLVNPKEIDTFERAYPALSRHLADRYRKAGQFTDDERQIDIYVETSRSQSGTDGEFGWPCFAAPASGGQL